MISTMVQRCSRMYDDNTIVSWFEHSLGLCLERWSVTVPGPKVWPQRLVVARFASWDGPNVWSPLIEFVHCRFLLAWIFLNWVCVKVPHFPFPCSFPSVFLITLSPTFPRSRLCDSTHVVRSEYCCQRPFGLWTSCGAELQRSCCCYKQIFQGSLLDTDILIHVHTPQTQSHPAIRTTGTCAITTRHIQDIERNN